MTRGKKRGRGRTRKSDWERFNALVEVQEWGQRCWYWLGAITTSGHGCFRVWDSLNNKWKVISAHKFSYLTFKGEVGPDVVLRHKCDIRHCVNPEHLEPGTQIDNVRDMIERGRGHWQREEEEECPF